MNILRNFTLIRNSILYALALLFIISCEKQLEDSSNFLQIKDELSTLNSIIKDLTAQLTSTEQFLKIKIYALNRKSDSINASIESISANDIKQLSAEVVIITQLIKVSNLESIRKLDSIVSNLNLIQSGVISSSQSINYHIQLYKKLLVNYIEVLKILQTRIYLLEIQGTVFKGAFESGSLISFYELDSTLHQTGRSFNATTNDDFGNYKLRAQNISGKILKILADGFYWNEIINETSSNRITLTGICKVDSSETININVLTHIERPRVEYLYNVKGLSFDSAKSQAVSEVLKAFGIQNPGIKRSEKITILSSNEESKALVAISSLFQGYRTESELTKILNAFAQDLEKDGVLTDSLIGNDFETHLYYMDTVIVLNNIKNRFQKIYDINAVNSLDMRYIKMFQLNTSFSKDKDLIEFPEFERTGKVKNILFDANTIFTGNGFGVSCYLYRKGIKIKVEVLNEDGTEVDGLGFLFPYGSQLGWEIKKINFLVPTYTSNGLGVHDISTGYNEYKKYRVNIYENGFKTPTRVKYVSLVE